MSEAIHKLQPDRTMSLRGVDNRGAAAALHSATPDGFVVSGVWGDQADFAVLMLWDSDNFYEHPRLKYLPDFEFSGVKLEFDLKVENLQPIDSDIYPAVPWNALEIICEDGTAHTVRLLPLAEPLEGTYQPAWVEFELQGTPATGDYVTVAWFGEHHTYQLYAVDTIASTVGAIHDSINAFSPIMSATQAGNFLRIYYVGPDQTLENSKTGANGNRMGAYTLVAGAKTELWQPQWRKFTGGESPTKWRITLDFNALVDTNGVAVPTRIRQMWLTLAPAMQAGAFEAVEFEARFTGWTVTGDNRALKVAGAGSVRIEESDAWCKYSGASWAVESGWYSHGFSKCATAPGDSVEVTYHCQSQHDLYLGTSLYSDRGSFGVSLDGDAESALNCCLGLPEDSAVNTRRLVRPGVAAGKHVVLLTARGGDPVYFDFLEAAVLSDVPDALPARADLSPALDYDTDHSYKLPPARIMWNFAKLGYAGPMNEYVGVFWWNRRVHTGRMYQAITVTFNGTPEFSAITEVVVGIVGAPPETRNVLQHLNLMGETAESLARAFELEIGRGYTTIQAEVEGKQLRIYQRSTGAAYHLEITASPKGNVYTEETTAPVAGNWMIDDGSLALNRAAVDWHEDLFQECADRGLQIVSAFSMELVNPPAAMASRYPSAEAVETSTGFGTLKSTHCAFVEATLAYHKKAFKEIADLQAASGLTPRLQFGEFCWWYFRNAGSLEDPNVGMAYCDEETKTAAETALGRPLWFFKTPDDDPAQHQADADFLAGRLVEYCRAIRDHVRVYHPAVEFEILLPLDVNYPSPAGVNLIGGRLNHAVNVPVEFQSQAAAPFDRIKIEALDFGAWSHNLDLTRWAWRWPYTQGGWPKAKCHYNLAIFGAARPAWERELVAVSTDGIGGIVLWAFDHVGLLGWDTWVPLAASAAQEI